MNTIELLKPHSPNLAMVMGRIWPEPYATPAADAYYEGWDSGEIYLIVAGSIAPDSIVSSGIVVGVTGYFLDPNSDCVYLRWTGVFPEFRRKGHAATAIAMLRGLLVANYAGRKLVELVPDNEYGAPVKQFFLAQGFQEDLSVYTPPDEGSYWPTVPMSITI